jgi:dihydrofolate reductase
MGFRIWHYEKLVKRLIREYNCVIGRKTYDLVQWKGPKTWVLTRKKKWSRSGVGKINSIEDFHLHIEGPVYVLGGNSLFQQLKPYADEIHLYVINNLLGSEPWIKLDMKNWKPVKYTSRTAWSYAHLEKSLDFDLFNLNEEILPS